MLDPSEMPLKVESFLRAQGEPDDVTVTAYEPILGGYSRLMAKVSVTSASGRGRYVLRGDPPPGQALWDTDRDAEWSLLSALNGNCPVPRALWYDRDGSSLGTKTIVMECLPGPSLNHHLAGKEPDEVIEWVGIFADVMGRLHTTDVGVVADVLRVPDSWDSYIDERVGLWRQTESAHSERNPYWRYVAAWCDANRPPPAPLGLVHGELNNGNLMLNAEGGLSIVDWELAHVGDPREDLGYYRYVAGFMIPPDLIGAAEEYFYERYRAATGFGEDVVNPDTTAYFAVLSGSTNFTPILASCTAMGAGASNSIHSAYVLSAMSAAHRYWLQNIDHLESSKAVGATA